MQTSVKRSTLVTALLVAFIDFLGVGLVYPLFSSMLFDSSYPLVSSTLSHGMRGAWFGLLIALTPLMQFFTSPLWGTLSDNRGRKKPLQLSLGIALFGYTIALWGIYQCNLLLLLLSRLLIGIAAGNTAIVQASIADFSTPENRTKNFGLYTAALGSGFALGPFLGGVLSAHSYSLPFLVALMITMLNLLFSFLFFEETIHIKSQKKLSPWLSITQLIRAFQPGNMRNFLLASFLYNFGWSYFFEFAPIYLIEQFHFSALTLGISYGIAGTFYALSSALLIRPFVNRFQPHRLFLTGILCAALAIFILPFIPNPLWLWPIVFLLCFFVSFVTPTAITLISEETAPENRGEALGNLNAVNAAAFFISPLLSGAFAGIAPVSSMWLGGTIMLLAAWPACFKLLKKQIY